MFERFMSPDKDDASNKPDFSPLSYKDIFGNSQRKPLLNEPSSRPTTEIKENHPLYQLYKDFPLRSIIVYVEIFSNGVNISETCYNYLEKLGAQIEKRMNKKCNLVIWKEGQIKTLEKAKEYDVPVVNSLWVEDCTENFHCASYDKYPAIIPEDVELALASIPKNNKKRKAVESFDQELSEISFVNDDIKSTIQRTRRKKNNDDFKSESKVEIRLGCQRKLCEIFENKQNKHLMFSPNSMNFDEGLKAFAYNPSKKKRAPKKEILDKENQPDEPSLVMSKAESNTNQKLVLERASMEPVRTKPILEDVNRSMSVRDLVLSYAKSKDSKASDKDVNAQQENSVLELNNVLSDLGPEYKIAPKESSPIVNSDDKEEKIDVENSPANEVNSVSRLNASPVDNETEQVIETENENKISEEIIKDNPMNSSSEKEVTLKLDSAGKVASLKDIVSEGKKTSFFLKNLSSNPKPKTIVISKISTGSKNIIERSINRSVDKKVGDASSGKRADSAQSEKASNKNGPPSSIRKNLFDTELPKGNLSRENSLGKVPKTGSQSKKTIKSGSKYSANKDGIDSSNIKNLSITNGIVFTNVSGASLAKAKEFCEKFSFTYLEDDLANVPFMEMLVYQGVQTNSTQQAQTNQLSLLPRNYKITYAMLKGKSVISQEWIEASLEKGELQDVEQYKFSYNNESRKSLFAKTRFYVDQEFESVSTNNVSKTELETLVAETGGSIFDNMKACDFYIARKTTKKRVNIPPHIKIVTPQWIIDSIIEGKLMTTQYIDYTVF